METLLFNRSIQLHKAKSLKKWILLKLLCKNVNFFLVNKNRPISLPELFKIIPY
jgi:hypothetical protein